VHRSLAAKSSQFSHGITVALRVGQASGKLANNVAQTMRLLLPRENRSLMREMRTTCRL
jgi:hypothetical protein